MTFKYQYRDRQGALVRGDIEAKNRQDVFVQLKRQGIVPISVEEVRTLRDGGTSSKTQGWLKGLVAGVLVVIASVTCYFLFSSDPEPQKKPAPAKVKLDKPAPVRKTPEKNVQTNRMETLSGKTVSSTNSLPSRSKKKIVEVKLTPEEQAEIDKMNRDTTLRTVTENRLALLASIPPGMPVPPMPEMPGMDKDFEKAAKNVITALPGDTEKDLLVKQFVIQMKERIRQAQDEGKTPSQAIREYEGEMNKVAHFRREVLLAARQMQREGNDAEARRMVNLANEELREIGALEIDLDHKPKPRQKK